MIWRRSDLLVLSVLVPVLTVNVPPVLADGLSSSTRPGASWAQRIPGNVNPEEDSHHHLSRSGIRPWLAPSASDPSPASFRCSIHHSKSAQLVKEKHTQPAGHVPSQTFSETMDDTDGDEPGPAPTDPNSRPVPTKWLMLGYSRAEDIPTSLPSATGQHQDDHNSRPPTAIFSDHRTRQSQRDWMQGFNAQVVGALILFPILVVILEGLRYLWRTSCRTKDVARVMGEVALHGDEKQLRAFSGDIESRYDIAATGVNTSN